MARTRRTFSPLGIPAGVRNWVAKYPQKHIAEQFGSEVTRIRPIHISLVRDIAGISDLNNFENEVEGVVMGFEKVHGTINKTFEFKPTTGKVVPQKEPWFYVYNLSAVGATSGDLRHSPNGSRLLLRRPCRSPWSRCT